MEYEILKNEKELETDILFGKTFLTENFIYSFLLSFTYYK